jgi:hypothetical protein
MTNLKPYIHVARVLVLFGLLLCVIAEHHRANIGIAEMEQVARESQALARSAIDQSNRAITNANNWQAAYEKLLGEMKWQREHYFQPSPGYIYPYLGTNWFTNAIPKSALYPEGGSNP